MKKTKKIIALLVAILTIVLTSTPVLAAGRTIKQAKRTCTTINTTVSKVKEKSELKAFLSMYPIELQTSYANLEIALANHSSLTLITRENGEVLI